jgi:hypothetical protein
MYIKFAYKKTKDDYKLGSTNEDHSQSHIHEFADKKDRI